LKILIKIRRAFRPAVSVIPESFAAQIPIRQNIGAISAINFSISVISCLQFGNSLLLFREEVMDMSFGTKLKEARKAKGFTQKELAEKAGTINTVISNWENDVNRPGVGMIEQLCGILEVSPRYFFTPSDTLDISKIPGVLPVPRMVKKPLLGAIMCEEPILAAENLDGYVDVPEDFDCDCVLRCRDESMTGARLRGGSLVYILLQSDVNFHEIAAIILDGDAVILRRVYRVGDHLVLMAENPAFPPIVVNGEHTARIIGKAVGFTSTLA